MIHQVQAQVPAHRGDGLRLVVHHDVDIARLRVIAGAAHVSVLRAELRLRGRDREVGQHGDRGVAVDGAPAHDRDGRRPAVELRKPVADLEAPSRRDGDGRWRQRVVQACAAAVGEADQRPAVLHGEVEELGHLAVVAVALRAAQHALVVTGGDHGLAMHEADARYQAVGERLVPGSRRAPREGAVLDEALEVEERRQTFAGGEPSVPVDGVDDSRPRIVAAPRTCVGDLAQELRFQVTLTAVPSCL